MAISSPATRLPRHTAARRRRRRGSAGAVPGVVSGRRTGGGRRDGDGAGDGRRATGSHRRGWSCSRTWTSRGFTFFTNYESRKAGDLAANNRASLLFYWRSPRSPGSRSKDGWHPIRRRTSRTPTSSPRPLESRWSAYASPQSRPMASRDELEARVDEVRQRFGDDVPRPPSWGGYRLQPARVRVLAGKAESPPRPARLRARRWLLASRAARPVVELAVFGLRSIVRSRTKD